MIIKLNLALLYQFNLRDLFTCISNCKNILCVEIETGSSSEISKKETG